MHRRRHVGAPDEIADPLDRVAHQVPTDVVGVPMGGQHPREAQAFGADQVDELVDAVRRIDRDALTPFPVSDEVHEVDHLPRDLVTDREVASRQQLSEEEPFVRTVDAHRKSNATLIAPVSCCLAMVSNASRQSSSRNVCVSIGLTSMRPSLTKSR